MLTRLEVQGFANLLDVDLRLGPLTVLIGHNGAGKTNVLAAARLLSLLARFPIDEAVSRLGPWEGERASPLTRLDGWTAPRLRLAAELIVEQEVRDCLGVSAAASTATLRYEVVLVPREREAGLALLSESLVPIRHTEAHRKTRAWATRTLRDSFTFGRRAQPLVSTDEGTIRIHHDGQAARQLLACDSPATTLCGAASADFPTLLAARRALEAVVDLELPADGGSRLTALGALAATASAGTCCIEQPDAGVHPDRCTELATLLRDGAVDPSRALGSSSAPRTPPSSSRRFRPRRSSSTSTASRQSERAGEGTSACPAIPPGAGASTPPARSTPFGRGFCGPTSAMPALRSSWSSSPR